MRILVLGVGDPPEEFLKRKFDGLARAGVEVLARRQLNPAALRKLKPDLIHFEWNSAAIANLEIDEIWVHPVVISCRGTQIRVRPHITPKYAEALRASFSRAAAVHCVCETVRAEAIAIGLDPLKAEVIYPAVDTTEWRPRERERRSGQLRLLAVGALIWTKGYEYALLTVRRLVDDGVLVHLDIIGSGNERQRVLFTIRDLGLDNFVTLLGAAQPSQVRDNMQQCDIFLHSSLSEGISNAALEAMACGLPVVTSDCGGMREAVLDGINGYVVPVRNPSAAAAAVARLASNAALRAQMGRDGRAYIEQRFQLDDQIKGFLELYARVVRSSVSA